RRGSAGPSPAPPTRGSLLCLPARESRPVCERFTDQAELGEKAMPDATEEFFDELARRGHEPLLEKAKGTVRYDLVDGEQTDHWLVTLDQGGVTLSRHN